MTDIDHEILNNPELGSVGTHLPYLDEVEAQIKENQQAAAEGRKPRKVKPRARVPHGVLPEPGEALTEYDYFGDQATKLVESDKENQSPTEPPSKTPTKTTSKAASK